MKVVIAGSRDVNDYNLVKLAIDLSGYVITEVVCGKATGVDTYGELWATENNIPVKEMPAKWKTLGKAAGPVRNGQMADYCDAGIIVWNGTSPGTKNMIYQMKLKKKPFFLYKTNGEYGHV